MNDLGEINTLDDVNFMLDDNNDSIAMLSRAHKRMDEDNKNKNKEELRNLIANMNAQEDVNVCETEDIDYDTNDEIDLDLSEMPGSPTINIQNVSNLTINIIKK